MFFLWIVLALSFLPLNSPAGGGLSRKWFRSLPAPVFHYSLLAEVRSHAAAGEVLIATPYNALSHLMVSNHPQVPLMASTVDDVATPPFLGPAPTLGLPTVSQVSSKPAYATFMATIVAPARTAVSYSPSVAQSSTKATLSSDPPKSASTAAPATSFAIAAAANTTAAPHARVKATTTSAPIVDHSSSLQTIMTVLAIAIFASVVCLRVTASDDKAGHPETQKITGAMHPAVDAAETTVVVEVAVVADEVNPPHVSAGRQRIAAVKQVAKPNNAPSTASSSPTKPSKGVAIATPAARKVGGRRYNKAKPVSPPKVAKAD